MNLGWTSERKKFKPWLMINTQKGKERDLLFWTVPWWWILLCMYRYFHHFVRLTNESWPLTKCTLCTVSVRVYTVHCTVNTQWTWEQAPCRPTRCTLRTMYTLYTNKYHCYQVFSRFFRNFDKKIPLFEEKIPLFEEQIPLPKLWGLNTVEKPFGEQIILMNPR